VPLPNTSESLLDRLQSPEDAVAWERLVQLYTPLIRHTLARHGLDHQDSDDLMQDVFSVVVRKFPEFRRAPQPGAFRNWLRTITVNCLRGFWRKRRGTVRGVGGDQMLEQLAQLQAADGELFRQWDLEHDLHITQGLLNLIRTEFESMTWNAFERFAIDGLPASEVAAELGISENAVFIAKSRVLRRLRQEGNGLID
jgi:RNA polymerase sigma-70 factor (ECF subfamily)